MLQVGLLTQEAYVHPGLEKASLPTPHFPTCSSVGMSTTASQDIFSDFLSKVFPPSCLEILHPLRKVRKKSYVPSTNLNKCHAEFVTVLGKKTNLTLTFLDLESSHPALSRDSGRAHAYGGQGSIQPLLVRHHILGVSMPDSKQLLLNMEFFLKALSPGNLTLPFHHPSISGY